MDSKKKRVNLYDRLPEIYRIKDEEKLPSNQLKDYLSVVEQVFGEIHKNIESFYHDLFIETCDEWVIPYIGDLLGNTLLRGDPWTLRADVADTIALRRRKGTLLGIERLTYDLTQWGVHCVELRENLLWNQHLNHKRPDYANINSDLNGSSSGDLPRGGTLSLRNPASLSLINTPFDPFAYTADLTPHHFHGRILRNVPNLAVFLWRLETYQVRASPPSGVSIKQNPSAAVEEAKVILRAEVHPLSHPVTLFNTHRFQFNKKSPIVTTIDAVTQLDETPNPIPAARLNRGTSMANPGKYFSISTYDENDASLQSLEITEVGLQLHLPKSAFDSNGWAVRGADLCGWEQGIRPVLRDREIIVDPNIGRVLIGVETAAEGDALKNHLLITYTYGAVGPVGAHPISRLDAPTKIIDEDVTFKEVNYHLNPNGLRDALANIQDTTSPIVIEIKDSMVHDLDIDLVPGSRLDNAKPCLTINRTLIIRAGDGQRPIIRLLNNPLRFRPTHVIGSTDDEQEHFNQIMANLMVRLEGLYLTFGPGSSQEPLIARAALNSLEVVNCTLEPGGFKRLDGQREPIRTSIELESSYGFSDPAEEEKFNQAPVVISMRRSITGPIFADDAYALFLAESIIDAGTGGSEVQPNLPFAISGSGSNTSSSWGPPTTIDGVTVFGRARLHSINGRGGLWKNTLEVLDNQYGCIKFSYFSGDEDRLPQNHGCLNGTQAKLAFVSGYFDHHAYGQLFHTTDYRIRERGPNDDAMGAFGFLQEAHKWHNIQLRYREFLPVGATVILLPVT